EGASGLGPQGTRSAQRSYRIDTRLGEFRWAVVPDDSHHERRTRMYRKLVVGMAALACYLTFGVAAAHAQTTILGKKTQVSGPYTVVFTQYESFFQGQKGYFVTYQLMINDAAGAN